ncbi:hypothetical protein [Altericroceibacterium xinjiangense]|uniref:hypothetical protein n=1 Tax=Altericroceibacterium xinjiangense TaxID=762261 RepID=UPI0013DFB5B1|nr:hypothetical protein [Altericroceibacterium xinjiangense]
MIEAKVRLPASFAARLAAKADKMAQARAVETLLARRSDPSRWRKAGLLWPLFAKD